MYAPSQWETTLQCNVVSHWLSAYTKWPLNRAKSMLVKSLEYGGYLCFMTLSGIMPNFPMNTLTIDRRALTFITYNNKCKLAINLGVWLGFYGTTRLERMAVTISRYNFYARPECAYTHTCTYICIHACIYIWHDEGNSRPASCMHHDKSTELSSIKLKKLKLDS